QYCHEKGFGYPDPPMHQVTVALETPGIVLAAAHCALLCVMVNRLGQSPHTNRCCVLVASRVPAVPRTSDGGHRVTIRVLESYRTLERQAWPVRHRLESRRFGCRPVRRHRTRATCRLAKTEAKNLA